MITGYILVHGDSLGGTDSDRYGDSVKIHDRGRVFNPPFLLENVPGIDLAYMNMVRFLLCFCLFRRFRR